MSAPVSPGQRPAFLDGSPESLRLGVRELLVIVGVWSFLALVAIAGRLLDPRIPGLAPQDSAAVVGLTLVEYTLWMLLTPPLLIFAAQVTRHDRHRLPKVLRAGLVGMALAVLIDATAHAMRDGWSLRRFGDFGFVDDLMVYFAVLFAGVARAGMLRARVRSVETAQLQAQASQLQVQLADARLDALHAQLDPHFLFNTLNAVSALVERDPRGVRRMISRLSELLRHSLEEGASEVTLQRELDLLERYLDIMRVRFGDRLRVGVDADDTVRRALVPNLVLQPIVENAIKHAVAPRESGGAIVLEARRIGDRLVLRIRDDGPGPGASSEPPGSGVGLRNTRARLSAMYGDSQHLELSASPDGPGTIVEISLPYRIGAA